MNGTENLIVEADTLLSRYRRKHIAAGDAPLSAGQADFPVLTELVADIGIETPNTQSATSRTSGVTRFEPLKSIDAELVEQLSEAIRLQLADRLSALMSEKLDAFTSEILAEFNRITADTLEEVIRHNLTLATCHTESTDDSK